MARHDARQSSAAPDTTGPDPPLEAGWTASGGDNWTYTPVVSDGRVIAVNLSPEVVAFDAETGEQLWSYEVTYSPAGSPAVAGDTVYVHDGYRYNPDPDIVRALDVASGTIEWTYEIDGTDGGGHVVLAAEGTVYVTVADQLVALDGTTGERAWRFTAGDPHRYLSSVALGSDAAYVTAHNGASEASDGTDGPVGRVFALDPADETVRWSAGLHQPTDIATAGGRVLVKDGNTLKGFERGTGERRWEVPLRWYDLWDVETRPRSQFAVADEVVYHQTDTSEGNGVAVAAVALTDGTERARYELGYADSAATYPRLTLAGNRLYAVTAAGDGSDAWLDVLDVADGIRHTQPERDRGYSVPNTGWSPAVTDGSLFVGGADGSFLAMQSA